MKYFLLKCPPLMQEELLRDGEPGQGGGHLPAGTQEIHSEGQLQDLQQLAQGQVQHLRPEEEWRDFLRRFLLFITR